MYLSGGCIWVGVYVSVQYSASKTYLGKDSCEVKGFFDNLGCARVERGRMQ